MSNSTRTVGEKIKALREENNFTQKNISDFLCVDQSLISKIESDERQISVDILEKLSNLFGCSSSYFTEDNTTCRTLSFAFRANELTEKDLNVISDINKIALNADFMSKLLSGVK